MLFIQSILFFILGAACASFFMLLLAPIIWRRAVTLAHRAVRMEIPLSLNEVEAEHDFARAIHAVEICRMEEKLTQAKSREMAARLVLDQAQAQICYLAPFEDEAIILQQTLSQMRAEVKQLQQENNAYRLKLEKMARLFEKNGQQQEKTKAQKSMIKSLKRQISALRKQLDQLEKQKDALVASQQSARERSQMENAQLSDLRQEMQQIAAQLVANIALAQDETGPLYAMIKDDDKSEGKDDLAGAIHHAMIKGQEIPTDRRASESL